MSAADDGTLRRLAAERPGAHPLAWQIRWEDHGEAPPPHLRELCGGVFRGMSPEYPEAPKKLCRIYPREHGKSATGAGTVPSWSICRDPSIRVLLMSETASQAKGLMQQVKDTIGVDDGSVVPGSPAEAHGLSVRQDTARKLTFEREATHREPTVRAAGFDTGVTGGHYDLLVFDDVVSWKTQRTQARRNKAWHQFSDYSQNLGSEGESVYLVLGTRKHPQDLYSQLEESFGWDVVTKPAISDWSVVERREFVVVTAEGRRYDGSELGDIDPRNETVTRVEPKREVPVLWPERYPLSKLLEKYVASMGGEGEGSLIWKRENQNDPEALMGRVLGEDMLHFEESLPGGHPDDNRRLAFHAGVDIGIEDDPQKAASNDADYWSVTVGGHDSETGITYLIDNWRRRGMTLQQAIRWVDAKTAPYAPNKVMVESNQAQRWFVQTARDEGLRFTKSNSSGSKEDRIISMSSRFESGKVRLWDPTRSDEADRGNGVRTEDPWRGFTNEWAAFPTGAHDDRLDSAEIMLRGVGTDTVSSSSHSMGDLPLG